MQLKSIHNFNSKSEVKEDGYDDANQLTSNGV